MIGCQANPNVSYHQHVADIYSNEDASGQHFFVCLFQSIACFHSTTRGELHVELDSIPRIFRLTNLSLLVQDPTRSGSHRGCGETAGAQRFSTTVQRTSSAMSLSVPRKSRNEGRKRGLRRLFYSQAIPAISNYRRHRILTQTCNAKMREASLSGIQMGPHSGARSNFIDRSHSNTFDIKQWITIQRFSCGCSVDSCKYHLACR